jgi:hypothetical protein
VGEDFLPIDHFKDSTGPCPEVPGESKNESAFDIECHPVPGFLRVTAEAQRIALFHYATRSWEDFLLRMERGGGHTGGAGKHKERFFFDVQKCAPPRGRPSYWGGQSCLLKG